MRAASLRPCFRRLGLPSAAVLALAAAAAADDAPRRFEDLATRAASASGSFRPAGDAALDAAAANLRAALGPLDALLARSKSGADWREYLDWPKLVAQAASGQAADPKLLRDLEKRLSATETGLEMPDFVRVRKAVERYAELADTARGDGAQHYADRLGKVSGALLSAGATGQADALSGLPALLDHLTASGQAPDLVSAVRGAAARPNIHLEVAESLLAPAVDRPVDQVQPVDDVVLGTRVRGSGRTTGNVRLDFVPGQDRAIFDILLAATNVSHTRGTQGPVTVHTRGITSLDARRRIFLDENDVSSGPVEVSADTSTTVTGLGISAPIGKRIIRRIANRKIAESKPKAEAEAERKARGKLRGQFTEETEPAIGQMRQQFRDRVRGPLETQGLYPESLSMHTTDRDLRIVARKSVGNQLAAFSSPPAGAADNVITARIHETAVNNILEQKLGGRILTQDDVARLAKERNVAMPDSLGSDPDGEQKTWQITFTKYRPVSVATDDGRVKVTVRGDKFVSGDRSFPGMDIAATYAFGRGPNGPVLVREGNVQINPPGFKSGDRKLTLQETSLRRILQKRFDKVFKDVVEIEPLPLEGELASAGPLPMNELTARKDGWVVAGWRKRDAGAFVPAEVVLSERFVEATRETGEGIVRRVAAKVAERIDAAVD